MTVQLFTVSNSTQNVKHGSDDLLLGLVSPLQRDAFYHAFLQMSYPQDTAAMRIGLPELDREKL